MADRFATDTEAKEAADRMVAKHRGSLEKLAAHDRTVDTGEWIRALTILLESRPASRDALVSKRLLQELKTYLETLTP